MYLAFLLARGSGFAYQPPSLPCTVATHTTASVTGDSHPHSEPCTREGLEFQTPGSDIFILNLYSLWTLENRQGVQHAQLSHTWLFLFMSSTSHVARTPVHSGLWGNCSNLSSDSDSYSPVQFLYGPILERNLVRYCSCNM